MTREQSGGRGVYGSMFEQSMFLDHAAARKTGALALSITFQSVAVGVALLIPLIYSERLPVVALFLPLTVPLSAPPAPPPVEAARAQAARPSILPGRVFFLHRLAAAAAAPAMIDASAAPSIGVAGGAPAEVSSSLVLPNLIAVAAVRDAAPAAVVKAPEKPVAVGGEVQAAKLVRKVIPAYPPLARAARVSGSVHLIGVIARDGTIQQLQVVSGNPLLVAAAVSAVRQWVYRPTLLDGAAVEVIAPIEVIFTLSQ